MAVLWLVGRCKRWRVWNHFKGFLGWSSVPSNRPPLISQVHTRASRSGHSWAKLAVLTPSQKHPSSSISSKATRNKNRPTPQDNSPSSILSARTRMNLQMRLSRHNQLLKISSLWPLTAQKSRRMICFSSSQLSNSSSSAIQSLRAKIQRVGMMRMLEFSTGSQSIHSRFHFYMQLRA